MYICYKCQLNIIKKRVPLLNLLINCISARWAPGILSIKYECKFLFLTFLIIGFWNPSDNSLFKMFSFLIQLPEVFLSKVYKPLKHYL